MTLATYDLPEVRQFVEELKAKRSGCFEGGYCSTLDKLIACQLDVCRGLTGAIATWKERIFRGILEYDRDVESALREQVADTLETALEVVRLAYEREAECFEFARLAQLQEQARLLERYEAKWVRPRLAARPAYRKPLSPAEVSTLRAGLTSSSDQ